MAYCNYSLSRYNQLQNNEPPQLRAVLDAEARLRSMFATGYSSFAELEQVAILAGMAPLEAAKYQVLVLLLLAGAAALGAIGTSYWAVSRVTDGRDRLRLDHLAPAER